MTKHSLSPGFTLIELLVVISIISLLTSVILASLQSAHVKANEAVIKEELVQFRNLYETTNTANGSYAALQPAPANLPWTGCQYYNNSSANGYVCQIQTQMQCAQVFNHDLPASIAAGLALCNEIVTATGFFELGVMNATSLIQHYSIIGYLPGQKQYLCLGSGGGNSLFTTAPSTISGETGAGCPGNP